MDEDKIRALAERHYDELRTAQSHGRGVEAQQQRNDRELADITAEMGPNEESSFLKAYQILLHEIDTAEGGESLLPSRLAPLKRLLKSPRTMSGLLIFLILLVILGRGFLSGESETVRLDDATLATRISTEYTETKLRNEWSFEGVYPEGSRIMVEFTLPLGDAQRTATNNQVIQERILASLCPDADSPLWRQIGRERDILISARAQGVDFPPVSCRAFTTAPRTTTNGEPNPDTQPFTPEEVGRYLDIAGPEDLRQTQGLRFIR